MRKLFLYLVLMGLLFSGCSSSNNDYHNIYGFWGKEINDGTGSQKFVVYFRGMDNNIECQFHSYSNGIKFSSEIGSDIEFDGESLSFIANKNANVRYEGKLDTINQVITGKLIYANGSGREFDLKRISLDELSQNYPGLFGLTKGSNSIEQPEEINDGLKTKALGESKLDPVVLQTMVDSINNGEFGKVHSVLIAEDGKLVFEKYFDGFSINDLNSLQSCTKSIGSILIGEAIDKGFIKNVNQKVIDFFPDYKNKVDVKWNDVELKNLLTMSTGIDWERSVHDRIYNTSEDVIKSTFEQKFSHRPGELFEYRNPQTDLLSGIIINTTKQSVQDFAKEYLFDPLKITQFSWNNFKKTNYPLMSGSLALSAREMLKIGQLVLDNGKWDGKQIVSQKWIEQSTSFKINSGQMFGYGYLWWLVESQTKPGLKVIIATGISGQHIVIVPQIKLAVVTTADNMDKEPEFLLRMIDLYIIKSVK